MMSRKCLLNARTTLRRAGDRSAGKRESRNNPGPGFRLTNGFHLRIPIHDFHRCIERCRNEVRRPILPIGADRFFRVDGRYLDMFIMPRHHPKM